MEGQNEQCKYHNPLPHRSCGKLMASKYVEIKRKLLVSSTLGRTYRKKWTAKNSHSVGERVKENGNHALNTEHEQGLYSINCIDRLQPWTSP